MDTSSTERGIYLFGRFRLDAARRTLTCDGKAVKLAPRLFGTLLYLVENQGRLIEKDELLAAVWGGRIVEEANLTRAIATLRKVLREAGADDKIIVTAPGRGYRFVAAVHADVGALSMCMAQMGAQMADQMTTETAPEASTKPSAAEAHARLRPRWWRAAAAICLAVAGPLLASRLLPRPPAFGAPPHSVAVLAFANMSGDPAQDYLSDGISEELIDALGRLGELRVAARMSAFSFKNRTATVEEVAHTLNVGAVVEGSVRRQGSRLRITVHLIDAATGFEEWSHAYDRDQSDLFQTQADIATAVVAALRVRLAGEDAAKFALGGTASPGALDAYLRGLQIARASGGAATDRAALAAFEAALALDPNFAMAQTERAVALFHLASDDTDLALGTAHKMFADALSAADRAIALAPALGEAHAARGIILDGGFFDFAGAVTELVKAHTLAPGNAWIELRYSNAAYFLGQRDESLAAARRATELDPLLASAWDQLASGLMSYRRYDAAADTLAYAKDVMGVSIQSAEVMLGEMAVLKGEPERARAHCAAATGWGRHQCLAIADHALGRAADAGAELAALQAELGDSGAYNYAAIYAQWGSTAEALKWLAKAFDLRDQGLADIASDPLLDPLRATPAFQDILRKMKFPH